MAKQKLKRPAKRTTTGIKKAKTKPEGLGDTVEEVLEATGVAKVAKWILGEDCGCDDRKAILNRMFPYNKPNCLTQDEFEYLEWYYMERRNSIPIEVQKRLVRMYNRVFNENMKSTSCSACFLNNVHKKLEKVYNKYR